MLNLSFTVRLMCWLTSHLSACSKLFDLNTTRSMSNFTLNNCSLKFQVTKLGVGMRQSKVGSL